MSDDNTSLTAFGGTVRLFPLPNLVLFPQATQDLHVFEPRYRKMTADALADDLLIAPVLLTPAADDAAGTHPAIQPVACLGRIVSHLCLPDGRYLLKLRGLARVRLSKELSSKMPYRTARCAVMPDVVPADLPALQELRTRLATVILPQYQSSASASRHLRAVFDSDLPLGPLCDALAWLLPFMPEQKQQMLNEACVLTRAEVLIREASQSGLEESRLFPPSFSEN